jgi:adenine/guanine phosphoribosyltransferase-like PRPP-binding protein
MNHVVKKYSEIDHKTFMTIDEAVDLSNELAKRVSETGIQFEEVVGIANGAHLPAFIIANRLGLPYQMLTIRRKWSVVNNYLAKFSFIVRFFSCWYSIPVLNYPLIKVITRMNSLTNSNQLEKEDRFKGRKNILIVDDALQFGNTIKATKKIITNNNEECDILVAVISWALLIQNEEQVEVPDIYISRKIQHFPWSVNSPYYKEYQYWLQTNGKQ